MNVRALLHSTVCILCVLFLALPSCKKERHPEKSDSFDVSGTIVASTWNSRIISYQVLLIDLNVQPPHVRLLVDSAGESRVSPDGRKVLFTKISPAGSSDIYCIGIDGSNMVDLTNRRHVSESWADWSPDGSQVVFVGDSVPRERLYIMEADGSNIHSITDTTSMATCPRWSPLGETIAYAWRPASNPRAYFALHALRPDGTNDRLLAESMGVNTLSHWSPDGRLLCYTDLGMSEHIINMVDGSTTTLEYPGVKLLVPLNWTSDGRFLIDGFPTSGTLDDIRVYAIRPGEGEEASEIVNGLTGVEGAVGSWDSKYVTIFGHSAGEQGMHLYVARMNGTDLHRIATIDTTAGAGLDLGSRPQWVR